MKAYHVEINSFYIRVKCRYKGKEYGKYMIQYYTKASDKLFHLERNVKIKNESIKHWKNYLTIAN